MVSDSMFLEIGMSALETKLGRKGRQVPINRDVNVDYLSGEASRTPNAGKLLCPVSQPVRETSPTCLFGGGPEVDKPRQCRVTATLPRRHALELSLKGERVYGCPTDEDTRPNGECL